MTDVQSGVPSTAQPFTDPSGFITQAWRQFLVTLWSRTGGGSGAPAFNQNTPFDLIAVLVNTVARTLVERMADYITIKDFGAVCDGVTNDLAAWNKAVAAVNAGVIGVIRVPGRSLITGSVATITNTCAIEGWGVGVSQAIQSAAAGDVTMLTVDLPTKLMRFSMRNISLVSNQANSGQALSMRETPFNLSNSINLANVDVRGQTTPGFGFNRGIEGINVTNATFVNVNHYGYVAIAGVYPATVQQQAWAWWVHAEIGKHSVNNRWTDCDVTWVILAWKCGPGDIQGFSWITCCATFLGQAWDVQPTDTTDAPYFEWVNCQSEVFQKGLYCNNSSWVIVADCEIYVDQTNANARFAIHFDDCIGVYCHDNIINISDDGVNGQTDGVVFNNVNQGTLHHNSVRGFKGYGYRFTGTTQNCMTDMDTVVSPVAGATEYANDGANASLNKRRRFQSINGILPTSASATASTTVGTTPTSVLSVAFPSWIGDELEFQAYLYLTPFGAAANGIGYGRVREITHAPGSANPYQVIQYSATRNNITDTTPINNTAGGGVGPVEGFIMPDATVRVIATATDAVFSLDVWDSVAFLTASIAELRVIRR